MNVFLFTYINNVLYVYVLYKKRRDSNENYMEIRKVYA